MAGWDDKGLGKFIRENRRAVQVSNLSAEAGFAFEDDKLLEIRRKIESSGKPLEDIDGVSLHIGLGLSSTNSLTQQNKSASYIDEMVNKYPGVVYKYILGRNIEKYNVTIDSVVIAFKNGWTNSLKKDNAEEFIKANYRELYDYMIEQDRLSTKGGGLNGSDKRGEYWWELRSCRIYHKMEEPYIVYSDISADGRFAYIDKNNCYADGTAGIICGNIDKKSATALLNSRIVLKAYSLWWASSKLGGTGLRWKPIGVKNIVIPNNYCELAGYTEKIQKLKSENKNTLQLEQEVEKIVQQLYGLTDNDVDYLFKQ